MAQTETLELLTEHPFLQGISPVHLEAMADCTQRVTVSSGQFLGRECEPATAFYLLRTGWAAIEIHKPERGPVRLQTIGPGDVVGWSWLVPPHRWQFDARVLETIQALAIDAGRLRQRCGQDHELGYQLLQRLVTVIGHRLSATRRQLLDLLP